MTKPYNQLDEVELKMEKMRLEKILSEHPSRIEYKQTKKSLERINNLYYKKFTSSLLQGGSR